MFDAFGAAAEGVAVNWQRHHDGSLAVVLRFKVGQYWNAETVSEGDAVDLRDP
jgi:hypothetical protein